MKREIKIGVFTILMIIVAWGGVRFLSGIDLFSNTQNYYASYSNINGIQGASPIYIKGVKVGSVTAIGLDKDVDSDVILTLNVDSKYDIPKNSKAKIFGNGLMNGKAIEIVLGKSNENLTSGDTIASESELDIMEVAGSELNFLKQRIDTVTMQLTTTLANLNTLIESNDENISGTIANLNSLSANLNSLLMRNDENLTEMFEGLSQVSQIIGGNSAQIDSIIRNVNSLTLEISDAKLGESLAELSAILSQINSSEGSAGKIINDEALYNNLASASANLDSLLYDVKQNPKRYVNISVFGSNEVKAQERADKRARKRAEEEAKDLAKSANR